MPVSLVFMADYIVGYDYGLKLLVRDVSFSFNVTMARVNYVQLETRLHVSKIEECCMDGIEKCSKNRSSKIL